MVKKEISESEGASYICLQRSCIFFSVFKLFLFFLLLSELFFSNFETFLEVFNSKHFSFPELIHCFVFLSYLLPKRVW